MDFTTPGYEDLELSTQILIKEALKRHIEVEVLDRSDNFIRLRKNEKTEYIKQATRTSLDSYIAPLIMENKSVTKKVLAEKGIAVPRGAAYSGEEEALSDFRRFAGKPVVVKPKSTNFGTGITILKNPVTPEDYRDALETAFRHDSTVITEEFFEGLEYRFLVIGDEVTAVLFREPANITGDGIHSIEELVEIKNLSPLRGKGYTRPLEKIATGAEERDFLALQNLNFKSIPENDRKIFLRKNSNISTGGDSIDMTDEMPKAYMEIALSAAKAAGAVICGADIVISDISLPPFDSSAGKANYSVIELNFNPALHIHAYPHSGTGRPGAERILDLLGLGEESHA